MAERNELKALGLSNSLVEKLEEMGVESFADFHSIDLNALTKDELIEIARVYNKHR